MICGLIGCHAKRPDATGRGGCVSTWESQSKKKQIVPANCLTARHNTVLRLPRTQRPQSFTGS